MGYYDSKVGAVLLLSLELAREGLRDERDAETKETTERQQCLCGFVVVAK